MNGVLVNIFMFKFLIVGVLILRRLLVYEKVRWVLSIIVIGVILFGCKVCWDVFIMEASIL